MTYINQDENDEVALCVDALNPIGALKLYEGLGYVTYKTLVEYTKVLK